jgi:hypothetical protein
MDWSPIKYLKSQNCQNTGCISFLEYNIFTDYKFFKVRHFPIVYITEDITVFSMEAAKNGDLENIRKIFLGFLGKGPYVKFLMMTLV